MSVVIPPATRNLNQTYFLPGFIKINVGQTIKWINADDRHHNLIFTEELPSYGISIGEVKPKDSISKNFNVYVPKIDYTCALHPEERGTIIIHTKDKKSGNRNLRYLKEVIQKIPDTLGHVNNHVNNIYEPIFEGTYSSHVTINKFVDPKIHKILSNPFLYQLQSKDLTLAFWDISRFSILCNILKNEPIAIVGFLIQYFDEAVRIIHKHNGIIDKFIGDGILAYFNFDDPIDEYLGTVNAINAALELRTSFEEIKKHWIHIWGAHFHHKDVNIGIKCGINHGNVLFGLLDTETRSQITVVGTPVNLASRLEGVANNSEIIISPEIMHLVSNKFKTRTIPVEYIQSFPEIKEVYEILEPMN